MPPKKGPAPTQVKSEVAKDPCEDREEVDTSGEATPRVQEAATTMTSCITEIEGDLFDAPENAVLIHACNCKGSWGAGIAKVFKDKYPHAFKTYKAYCDELLKQSESRTVVVEGSKKEFVLKRPEGEVLLIPPQLGDYAVEEEGRSTRRRKKVQKYGPHWVACLFTSVGFGKGRSGEEEVLRNTRLAVEELKREVEGRNGKKSGEDEEMVMGELWGCRFNAGLFGVEWERTKGVLEDVGLEMKIVRPSD